jgi:hypothetical protein
MTRQLFVEKLSYCLGNRRKIDESAPPFYRELKMEREEKKESVDEQRS